MAEAEKQHAALEVLKGLNAAVKTTKLYPPGFPQVAQAFETGFAIVNGYLRKYGPISFSLIDDEPKLGGLPVSQKTLGKIHGEDIYQQLRLLKLDHLVLEEEISTASYKQLLVLFTTSPQLITREGGSLSYVANLGLKKYFPDDYVVEIPEEREDYFANSLSALREEHRVANEHLQSLITEVDGETVAGQKRISALAALKKDPDQLIDLIFAGIAQVLQGMHRSGEISFPIAFETLIRNVNRFTKEEERESLAKDVASSCLGQLDDFALHILILQHFSGDFGTKFYSSLLAAMSSRLDSVVGHIRQEEKVVLHNAGETSEQFRKLSSAIDRLFATEKGKQYLIRENAKKLLEVGEKERQAKRIQAGVRAILRGDVNSLKNREVIGHLPATIESLIARGKDKAAATIISNITAELMKGDEKSHSLLSGCLSRIGESLISAEKWGWLDKLSIPLLAWLKKVEKADEVLESIVDILISLTKYYWKNDNDKKADRILKLFFAIRTGKLAKSKDIVETIGRLQDISVEKAPLPALLERSVKEENDLVDRRLIMQGPLVARFLLNKLLQSQTTEERLKILELLNRMGPLLAPLLLEKLAEPMPWHGKRNLLKLLAQTGRERDATQVFDYLNHEDLRVQQEAFSCILILSGEDRKSNLLEALALATGPMKEQVVRALSPMADEEVVGVVTELLGDWEHFSDELRDSLLRQIIALLGKGASLRAEEALEEFLKLEGKGKARVIDESVWLRCKNSYRQVKTRRRELAKKQYFKKLGEEIATPADMLEQEEESLPRTDFEEEAHIASLLEEGDLDRATKLLVELIERAAIAKRFQEAEKLREWLIEIAPTALNNIIRSAEIIEEAKSKGIDNDFLNIWSALYDNLTTEEFNALYYAMEHKSCSEEESLIRQGEMSPALFFINQGKVKLFYDDKGKEILIAVLEQGQILGAETFFDASVWTVSATPLSKAEVSMLALKNTHNWANEFPALESKLQDFSSGFGNIKALLKEANKNRRKYKRYPATGIVLASLLDKNGREEGVQMKGEFSDISKGGLSFLLRISSKKNARVLLGRSMRLQVPSHGSQGRYFEIECVLVNVRSLYSMNNDYSAHVRFKRLLTDEELNDVLKTGASETL